MATVKTPNGKQYAGTVLRRITAAFFAFAAGTGAFAVEVSPDAAQEAVAGWVRLKEALGEQFDAAPASTATYQGRDGKGVFHVVSFEGGGYVVTSGDTDFTPILAWSKSGEFAATDENPLWCLIAGDTAMRAESQPSSGLSYAAATASPVATASPAAAGNAARWAALRAAAKPLSFDAAPSITSAPPDLRVPALAPQNDWSQSRIGNYSGTSYPVCFNYYTPANWPCGCVATSSAQVMRYFRWPQADNPVAVASFQCTSNDVAVTLSLMGGTYDWDNMPENINSYYNWSAASTEAWRQAVGKLCHDAGVAVKMQYGPSGSGAYVAYVPGALVNTFHYSNAVLVRGDVIKALLSSLDAKTPCVVSIEKTGSESGHAVMADGYGYSGNTLYVHFNMGWRFSNCNVWYNPPLFDRSINSEGVTKYDTINSVVCNISTNAARYSSIASGRVFDLSGNVVPGAAVKATCDGATAATATTDANGIYALYLPPSESAKTYSITATLNGRGSTSTTVSASRTYSKDGTEINSNSRDNDLVVGVLYAKLVDGTFAYFSDEGCTLPAETPAEGLAACKKVLFADDAEFQTLVPFTNEIAAAGVPVCLQSNVTLTADADWRAIDFDLNGKVITLMGWDLQVRKPQGTGRITAGNVLNPQGYSFTGSSNDGGSATYEWLWLGGSGSGANQNFTLPKSRTCYLKTKIHYYSSGISQSVRVKIDGTEIFNEKCSGTKTMGPYARTGYTAGTSYKIEILRSGSGNTQAYKWTTISPTSYLCFDIPEGEEYDPSDITFGGSMPGTSDFGGIGLQIHKAGKGKLVMSTAKGDIGGNGVASAVVEEGVLVNANDTGCGAAGSRIEVMDGAQFDTHGAAGSNSAYYDFILSGAGPDGLGAVANNTAVADAYDKAFIMRNITLATNAVIGGTQKVGLKNGNWTATTMTMDGHTVTYTNTTVYAGNMSYSGTGGIVVAPDAALSFYAHSTAAANCDVTVYGSLNQNNGGFTQVKSLVFETGGTCWLSDSAGSGSIPETVVTEKYAPNANHTNGGTCTLTTPRVQLGDESHLETTLDLSRLEGVFDGTNTTFYTGSTVTVDLGGREFQGSVLLMAWAEMSTATFVVDDANKDRLGLIPRPEGLYIFPGKVPSFVKYDVENNCWKFYDEDMNPFSGEWTLGVDYMKALFADDAEFQALAQHADEIAARHVTVFLQDDITLTADADWRALDFNLNGKTIVLKGYDLYVRKPQGEGRITAGNVLDPFGYIFYRNSNDGGDGYPWFWLGDKWGGAQQHFTLPKTRTCYLKTIIRKQPWSNKAQSVKVEIESVAIFDKSCTTTDGTIMGPYTFDEYTAGTSYKIDIMRSGSDSTQASKWTTISPTSYLYFDIDEGDEYDTSNLTFGGSTPGTSDFGGLGLQIRKLGKGNLVMGAANGDIGFAGVTTLCVEEGSVENAVSTGSGPSGAKVELLYGAQFDSKAATADGIYSLVTHTQGEDEGEDTLTYTNAITYANAVTYVGQGTVAVAQDAVLTFQNSATAADCAVNVFGGLIFAGNGLTTVKSLAFATGATFSSSGTLPTTVVTDTFAPNTTAEEGAAAAQPKVQMGDSSHLATTLDLSLIASAIDAKAMTFQSGSKVTVVVDPKNAAQRRIAISRDAETGERNGYVALWNAKPSDVEFVLCAPGASRYQLKATDAGLLLTPNPATTVILR